MHLGEFRQIEYPCPQRGGQLVARIGNINRQGRPQPAIFVQRPCQGRKVLPLARVCGFQAMCHTRESIIFYAARGPDRLVGALIGLLGHVISVHRVNLIGWGVRVGPGKSGPRLAGARTIVFRSLPSDRHHLNSDRIACGAWLAMDNA